jgi:hypothetical protein
VRWAAIGPDGIVGPEQTLALPADAFQSFYTLAGLNAPGDIIIVGVLVPAANGTDAELRLIAAASDGSPARPPGDPIATFEGGVDAPPEVAMGTSASGMYAGVAWIDVGNGPTYAFVDGQGQLVAAPSAVETPDGPYTCLGFGPGKDELTLSYQRATPPSPTWLIADLSLTGGVSFLSFNVTKPGARMGCARSLLYDNGGTPEYAMVWQNDAGSWLSVYYGPDLGTVKSFAFASSTDFGGSDLQPPLMGAATFGKDFGVLLARANAVELWRIDQMGNRRSGSLVMPSVQGSVGVVASVSSANLLTSTYADYTGPDEGRRLVIDAVCY